MIRLNRRTVIKGIVSMPVVRVLGATAQLASSSSVESNDNQSVCAPIPLDMNFVNLVFHGTWIYLIYPDHIHALAPSIEANPTNPVAHVAGMGGVRGIEDVLPSGSYELTGVEAATEFPPPDPWQSVVLDARKAGITKVKSDSSNIYYSIRLPFPEMMTPVGQTKLKLASGAGKLFDTKVRYLDVAFNRPGQRFTSVQVLTYRLAPKIKPTSKQDNPDRECFSDACYPSLTPPPIPDSSLPQFTPLSSPPSQSPVQGGQASPSATPFSSTYMSPSSMQAAVATYSQYHLAYVVHRRDESGAHDDHSFSRMMATLGVDVKSKFCSYHFDALPMSFPMGLTHSEVNLDDFPYEFEANEVRHGSAKGWYSETEVLQFYNLLNAETSARALTASLTFNQFLSGHSKPIGNCRSGNVIVTNPPIL